MSTELYNSINSDFIPRRSDYKRREVDFIHRPKIDNNQALDNVSQSVISPTTNNQQSTIAITAPQFVQLPDSRQWKHSLSHHRSLKYVGGAMVAIAALLIVIGVRSSSTAPSIVNASSLKPDNAIASVTNEKQKVMPGVPVRFKIPKINIDTTLDYVGLTTEGELDVPKDPTHAAWYNQGPRPGEVGSAVIDGHFGLKNDAPALFDNLHTLKPGDKLFVGDDTGATIVFVVRELKSFGPDEDATTVFRSNDGKAHLNLITCQGAWNKSQKSYSKRLVVFADKLQE